MQADAAPKKKSRGLLVLLVIVGLCLLVVPCIGITAAIAIPSFIGYMKRSKTSEAASNLRLIARAEESYCTERGNWLFPAGPVPLSPSGTKQLGDFAADATFTQLGVTIPDPVYYSYSIRPSPSGAGEIDLVAHGDLDGDSLQSTFTLHCGTGCTCVSEPEIENELE